MSDTSSLSARSSQESLRSSTSTAPSISAHFPGPLLGSMVWAGAELEPKEYILQLEKHEIENIKGAIVHFKLTGLPRTLITKATFPLSKELAGKLASLSDRVHHGRGVAVVRGLNIARLNDEEATIAFVGVSSYVASNRATDSYANQTLSHIRDATQDAVPGWARDLGLAGSKLPVAMDFHSDRFSGDVLALYVRNDGGANNGGEQYVVSFWKIYNEILETEPAVLETMAAADWPFELKEKDQSPYLELGPTLFIAHGKPICQLVKAPLLGSPQIPRSTEMPGLSKAQYHALDIVEGLARQFCAKIDRQVGDIQYINNLSMLHARSAYGGKPSNPRDSRHLLRMFLRDVDNMWSKPNSFRLKFDDPFVVGREQNIPIVDLDPWRAISGRDSHG